MQLVKVDAIRAEAGQAVLGRAADVLRTSAPALLVHLHTEFGRNHRFIPARAESAPKELLALPRPVDVGGVEETDPGIQCGVDYRLGLPRVDAPTKIVGADPDDGDPKPADVSCFQKDLPGIDENQRPETKRNQSPHVASNL